MKESSGNKSISTLAALLLLGVFAVGILSVLLGGANAYRRLTQRDRLAYDSRTCLQYVAAKIRQAPDPRAISFARFGDGDCLVIGEEIDGTAYLTRIYCHDGWLMELFAVVEGDFSPADGEKIMRSQSLSLTRDAGLLLVKLVDGNGRENVITLYLRGGEEGHS